VFFALHKWNHCVEFVRIGVDFLGIVGWPHPTVYQHIGAASGTLTRCHLCDNSRRYNTACAQDIEAFFPFKVPEQKDGLDAGARKWYIAIMQYSLQ
jgi:hypothetical protein